MQGWLQWGTIFLASTQALMIAPFFPSLSLELALIPSDLGLLTGGYALAYSVATLLAFSFFSHRHPTLLLRWGLIGLGLCNLAVLAVDGRTGFILLRLATAFPHAFLLPAVLTRIGDFEVSKQAYKRGGWVLGGHGASHLIGVPLLLLLVGSNRLDPSAAFALPGGILVVLGLLQLKTVVPKSVSKPALRSDLLEGWRSLWGIQSPRFTLLCALCMTSALSAFVYTFPTLHAKLSQADASNLAGWIFLSGIIQVSLTYLGGALAAEKGFRKVAFIAVLTGLFSAVMIAISEAMGEQLWIFGAAYLGCVAASSLRHVPLSVGLIQQLPKPHHFSGSTALSAIHQAGRGGAGLIAAIFLSGSSIVGMILTMILLLLAAASLLAAIQINRPSERNG